MSARDPLAAMVGVDKDMATQTDFAKHGCACCAHALAVALGHEATGRFELQLPEPVAFELVPAILRLEPHAQRNVGRRHEVNGESHDFRMPRVKNALRR